MLAPHTGDFQQLEAIVQRREQEVLDTGIVCYGQLGWGHEIEPRRWQVAVPTITEYGDVGLAR
jgi:hypothetical protein